MVQCEIKYDNNPNGIYFSGQTLSGVIEMKNERSRKIRALTLRIEGYAKCEWIENEETDHLAENQIRKTFFKARENYLDTFTYLIGNHKVAQDKLPVGAHEFDFSCLLPPLLPTSFESKYGFIRYQIKVEIERPWKYDIRHCLGYFAFTVIKPFDLNKESPNLRNPIIMETKKKFFLSSKDITLSAEIPMAGYVAGQIIAISVKIDNKRNKDVEETRISLMQIIQYHSQTPRDETRRRVEIAAEIHKAGVAKKSKQTIEAELVIPSVAPTNIAFCKVLQVSYEIHIVAKIGGINRSPVLKVPLIIGTVPLQAQQVSQFPPPIFHEAKRMIPTEEDVDDGITEENPFSPLYPVFSFDATTSATTVEPAPSSPKPKVKKIKKPVLSFNRQLKRLSL